MAKQRYFSLSVIVKADTPEAALAQMRESWPDAKWIGVRGASPILASYSRPEKVAVDAEPVEGV